jgi:hypothetical protein
MSISSKGYQQTMSDKAPGSFRQPGIDNQKPYEGMITTEQDGTEYVNASAPFHFETDPVRHVNWRNIENASVSKIVSGDLSGLLMNLDDIAFGDFRQDFGDLQNGSNFETYNMLTLMQYGL